VKLLPQENAQTLDTFKAGQIDGAWVPEPWATRLVQEGGGEILVDEKDLWPEGKYVTTNLLVTTEFLDAHPDVVQQLITGLGDAIDFIKGSPTDAEGVVAAGIEKATGKPIKPELVTASFANIEFTLDPVPSSLLQGVKNAEAVGLLDPVDNLEGSRPCPNAVPRTAEPEVTGGERTVHSSSGCDFDPPRRVRRRACGSSLPTSRHFGHGGGGVA
jgi:NitT/TauT family transport system substrate-binding protein